jgi:hypothetical protein
MGLDINQPISQSDLSFDDNTALEPSKGTYISFVGRFDEGKLFHPPHDFVVYWMKRLYPDENEIADYHRAHVEAYRNAIYEVVEDRGLDMISETSKDSLTVRRYTDPYFESGWELIVADCGQGGWIEASRVKIASFQGEASVPSGCAVPIFGKD